jgi:predicted trehalose synthase
MIVDFEGEPSRPLATRTEKRSPLRDVAGLLRSLDYARHAALRAGPSNDTRVRRADAWHDQAREAFLEGYLGTLRPAAPDLLPSQPHAFNAALSALELEKAAYEVRYELSHRPDWLPIPLAAFTCR